jgi:PadR family transcriptional regulator PadR
VTVALDWCPWCGNRGGARPWGGWHKNHCQSPSSPSRRLLEINDDLPKLATLTALVYRDLFTLEVFDAVNRELGYDRRLELGDLYPMMRGLEDAGFVTSYDGESIPERGGRPRRYYRLTFKGARQIGMNAIPLGEDNR